MLRENFILIFFIGDFLIPRFNCSSYLFILFFYTQLLIRANLSASRAKMTKTRARNAAKIPQPAAGAADARPLHNASVSHIA